MQDRRLPQTVAQGRDWSPRFRFFIFFSPKNVKFFLRNTLYHSFLHHYVSFQLLVRRRWTPNGRLVALTFHGMVSCIKSTENYKSEHETD